MIYEVNYVLKTEKFKTYTEEFHTLPLTKQFVERVKTSAREVFVYKIVSPAAECEKRLIYKLDNMYYSTYAADEYGNEQ
jgi:hypothetical protein